MSGILSLRPSALLRALFHELVFSGFARQSVVSFGDARHRDVRDHLGKALQCLLDIRAGRHIVFDSLDEGCIGNAPSVGRGVLAVSSLALFSL